MPSPTNLAYWTLGCEPAPWLVICHGAALDHQEFLPIAQSLAAHWRILLWDLPGHGQSQPMPSIFSVDRCAEALAEVMDAAGVASAVLLGFSFGGMVAQVFAKRWPERVAGFVFYACFTPHLLPPLVPSDAVAAVVNASFAERSWHHLRSDFAARCCLTASGRAQVEHEMAPIGKTSFMAVAEALLRASDFEPRFRISAPVALLSADQDSNGAALADAMAAYRQAYPDATEAVIANAGHCAHLDQPEPFRRTFSLLLDTIRRPERSPRQ